MTRSILTLTSSAVERIKTLMCAREKTSLGIRIGIRTKGCSGLSYTLEYADTEIPHDECVEAEGIKIFIDPKAIMFLLGTTMDYQEGIVESGFIFKNPNEKGRCGCGESFHV